MTNQIPNKIYLSEDEMPVQYYNLRSDMKIKPAPLLNPATLQPVTKDELTPVFCQELVDQELDDTTRFLIFPGSSGFLQDLPSFSISSCLPPGRGSGHPGANLLQIRRK